jgi:hypothetical protein
MKKRGEKKRGKTIKINLSNRLLYTILAIGILLIVGVGIYAISPGETPDPGHNIQTIGPPEGCEGGQFLMWQGSEWICANAAGLDYNWEYTSWGTCSEACATGTQTRNVWCETNDGQTVDDSYCEPPKPATQQSCNTQACTGTHCINCPWGYFKGGGSYYEYYYCTLNGRQGKYDTGDGWSSWSYDSKAAYCGMKFEPGGTLFGNAWEMKA